MLEILSRMIREEWRIHSSMFGGRMFALFPLILVLIAFLMSLMLPVVKQIIPIAQMLTAISYAFLLFGVSVGSFGLLGREIMNRRFGQASLLAYSSRTLPVSERRIFANFIVKDVIYYFMLWILPVAAGFALASPLISVGLIYALSLLSILTLSFLVGLSIAFFLSTVYAHSVKTLLGILAIKAASLVAWISYYNVSLPSLLAVLSFSIIPSSRQIALSLLAIVVLASISLLFLKVDYPIRKRTFNNMLSPLSRLFGLSRNSTFMSKDFLDFKRSEGGLGKIIFSFLLPLGFVWLLISVFLKFMVLLNPFIIFSLFLGIMSSSFYNWFTEFDTFSSYAFLPVKVSTLMRSKVNSYIIINLVPLAVLVLLTFLTGQTAYFLPSLFSFLSVSAYSAAITIYLSGLNPNLLLYNAKVFVEYLLAISPLLLGLIFLSVFPDYMIISLVLLPISYLIIRKSYKKWDRIEQPHF